ncbi:MAG: dimethylsulfoxide reductase, chain B [Ignavibacteria bacterium RBG_13_36_8]|nr:MAG: dimethylsulfoxide reductase, chain B [Ignavibacteria bacterium RBG_13_36_8]
MKKQYAFYFDSNNCSGCKTCQVACKDKNNLPVGVLWRRIYEVNGGDWIRSENTLVPQLVAYNISMSCNHCEDPICVKNCPTTALYKNKDGLVLIDENKCAGCRYCEWSCPYGSPQYDEEKGIMTKCDFCYDYLKDGKSPACVDACPMRVLDFGEFKELQKKYSGIRDINPLPSSQVTNPAIIIKPHRNVTGMKDIKVKVVNKEEV